MTTALMTAALLTTALAACNTGPDTSTKLTAAEQLTVAKAKVNAATSIHLTLRSSGHPRQGQRRAGSRRLWHARPSVQGDPWMRASLAFR